MKTETVPLSWCPEIIKRWICPLTIWTKKWNNKNQSISVQCITWDDYAQFVSCLSQCHRYFFFKSSRRSTKSWGQSVQRKRSKHKKKLHFHFRGCQQITWWEDTRVAEYSRDSHKTSISVSNIQKTAAGENFRVNVTSTDGARYPVHLTLCSFTHCMYRFVCYL